MNETSSPDAQTYYYTAGNETRNALIFVALLLGMALLTIAVIALLVSPAIVGDMMLDKCAK